MKLKSRKEIKKPDITYNLHVKNNHNYFANGICVSNCHLAKATSIKSINQKCFNAKYRIGFTGTMPDKEVETMMDYYTILSYIGPVLYHVTAKQLIDAGVLADIAIKNIIIRYPDEFAAKNRDRSYENEQDAIESYLPRNKVFKSIITNSVAGSNTLILVRHIDHLKTIYDYLKDELDGTHQVEFIYGKVKASRREQIRKEMDASTNYVLVASYDTFSTGLNVKNINNVILGSGYKSKYKVLQSIGRGLRRSDTKFKVLVFDLVDDLSIIQGTGRRVKKNHLYGHYEKRVIQYNREGFPNSETLINISE